MKIETDEHGNIVLKEVYSGVFLETAEGNKIGICMRDDGFEGDLINNEGHHKGFRLDMKTLKLIDV